MLTRAGRHTFTERAESGSITWGEAATLAGAWAERKARAAEDHHPIADLFPMLAARTRGAPSTTSSAKAARSAATSDRHAAATDSPRPKESAQPPEPTADDPSRTPQATA